MTVFEKIIAREIPAEFLFEDDRYVAFRDVAPAAPVHFLVVPRRCIPRLTDVTPADAGMVGGMFVVAADVMRSLGHADFRTVFNCGPGAQQTVFHLHLHALAGRPFAWPPG